MRNLTATTILILAALAVTPATQAAQSSQTGSVEQEIQRLENELTDAAKRGDAAVFERLLSDDYTTTAMASGMRTKAQVLADIKAGVQKTASISLEDVKVRVYGDTAVLTARQTSKGSYKGLDTSGTYHRLRVYVKQQGQWRAVALQTTPVAKG